ncbi:hypothetical protein QR680_005011 [Steinernema hermaphroditum]|uniref:Uncharacterized protein n=1 Tax=Steinernema hermaphroditum TaxID=289476 RepID=A0AA39HRS6_9BILA|nr:hypothetical protein QR680_005011 [Steinernema hermaphroditum]
MKDHEMLSEAIAHFPLCQNCKVPLSVFDSFEDEPRKNLLVHKPLKCDICDWETATPMISSFVLLYKQTFHLYAKYYAQLRLKCAHCDKKIMVTEAYFCGDALCAHCAILLHPGGEEHHIKAIIETDMHMQHPDDFLNLQIDYLEEAVRTNFARGVYPDVPKLREHLQKISKIHVQLVNAEMLKFSGVDVPIHFIELPSLEAIQLQENSVEEVARELHEALEVGEEKLQKAKKTKKKKGKKK